MSRAPETARAAARGALEAFGGGTLEVARYYDEPEQHSVNILHCADRPGVGFDSYSTVDLHLVENWLEGDDIRVEFACVVESSATAMANVLATSAFKVIKDGSLAAPGVVYRGLLKEYGISSTLEHVLWVPPFSHEQLADVDLGDGVRAHWLLAIPISEAERRFLIAEGYDRFEKLLAEHDVEYWNLSRDPLV
jgi:hypothetical protein